ncbi:hypothetical protein pb186bvf_004394 [Paramecium bursaria]
MDPDNRATPKLKQRLKQLESDPKINRQLNVRQNNQVVQLPKITPSEQSVTEYVDKEISQLEMNSRVRDLEIMMIDFKANMERRMTKTVEDNPQKFMQSFKQLEQQEMQLWKQVNDKQALIQDQIIQVKQQGDRNRDQLSQMILDLQKKSSELELKLQTVNSQQNGLDMIMQASKPTSQQQNGQNNNVDLELRLLRESIKTEKAHRDSVGEDLQRQWQEMHQRLVRQETDFYSKLKQIKDEFVDQQDKTKQQLKGLDSMKLQKINQDQDYLRNLIGSVESRIADEVEKRLKMEFENRNILENKLQSFKEEMRNDQKQILLNEQKFMKQMHDSVTSLNQIIKNSKEQQEANLAASQTIVTENIRSISKTLDVVKETTLTKVQLIEQGQRELNYRVGETKQMFQEHANLINTSLQKEFQKTQEQLQVYEKAYQKSVEDQNQMISTERQMYDEWKKQFTTKNLTIFQEISSQLKTQKGEMARDRQETADSIKNVKDDLSSSASQLSKLIQNQDSHIQQIQLQILTQLSQQRQELLQEIGNSKISIETYVENQVSQVDERSRQYVDQSVFRVKEVIIERIDKMIELQEEITDHKINQLDVKLKSHVEDREKIIQQRLTQLLNQEADQRRKLQELIEQYSSMMQNLKQQLEKEFIDIRKDYDAKIIQTRLELQNEYREMIQQNSRQFQQEIINLELRQNQKIDSLSDSLRQQLELLREYMLGMEKSIRSFVNQSLEQTKYELRAEIKEMENDLFKMRVWLLQQIDLMNKSMQDLHIQIQGELYMDRMYQTAIMEQFQDYLYDQLNNNNKERLEWQQQMENKQEAQELKMDQQYDQFTTYLKEEHQNFMNKIEQDLEEISKFFDQKLQDMDNEHKQLIIELETKLTREFQEFQNQTAKDLKELEDNTQLALNQICKYSEDIGNQLKEQVDQLYAFFEAKFHVESVLKQASEALEKERHAGIVGKLQKLVEEMERLEQKKNKIKKDLNEFVNGAKLNFKTLQDAVVAHSEFLNEIDARMTFEMMMQQIQSNQADQQFEVKIIQLNKEVKQLQDQNQEINDKLQANGETVANQLEQIQLDQEQQNGEFEKQIALLNTQTKEHTASIDKLNQEFSEQKEWIGSIEKMIYRLDEGYETKASVMRVKPQVFSQMRDKRNNLRFIQRQTHFITIKYSNSLENEVKTINDQQNLCIVEIQELTGSNQRLQDDLKQLSEGLAQIEGKVQNVDAGLKDVDQVKQELLQIQEEIKEIQEIQPIREEVNRLASDQEKIKGDYETMANDIDKNFKSFAVDIRKTKEDLSNLKSSKPSAQPSQQKDNELQNYGAAIESLNRDVNQELDKMKDQISELQTNMYQQQQGPKSQQSIGGVNQKDVNDLQNKVKSLETQMQNIKRSPQQSVQKIQGNAEEEINQINDKMNNLEKDVEASITELNQQIQQLQQDLAKLQKGGSQTPQQQPAGKQQQVQVTQAEFKKLNDELQETKQLLDQEFERVHKEMEILKKKAPQQQQPSGAGNTPASKNQQQTDGKQDKEIQNVKVAIDQMDQEYKAEFEKIYQALEEMQQSKGGSNGDINQPEIKKAVQAELAGVNKKIEELQTQIKGGQGKGAAPAADVKLATKVSEMDKEMAEMQNIIEEIMAKLNM